MARLRGNRRPYVRTAGVRGRPRCLSAGSTGQHWGCVPNASPRSCALRPLLFASRWNKAKAWGDSILALLLPPPIRGPKDHPIGRRGDQLQRHPRLHSAGLGEGQRAAGIHGGRSHAAIVQGGRDGLQDDPAVWRDRGFGDGGAGSAAGASFSSWSVGAASAVFSAPSLLPSEEGAEAFPSSATSLTGLE